MHRIIRGVQVQHDALRLARLSLDVEIRQQRILPQPIVIVEIFVAQREAVDSLPDQLARIAGDLPAVAGAEERVFMQPWSLLSGGKVVFTLPKIAVLRSFVMSHMIHHRAQLGLYLRLNDVPVPAIYGPSADETGM